MKKALLYRLFGFGKISKKLMGRLENEGIVLVDEGLKGSVTFKDFRAPGKYRSWKRYWHTCIISLTSKNLIGASMSGYCFDVSLTDKRIKEMNFETDKDGTLVVAFDAGLFRNDWSGKLEYRFKTDQAVDFIENLKKLV